MNSDHDCTFRPRLEALEDRLVLTAPTLFRFLLPPKLSRLPTFVGGNHTPAQIHTIVNPAAPVMRNVSVVPQHISLGLFDTPAKINVNGADSGIVSSGIRTPSMFGSDPGFTASGLPIFAPSHPVTPPPLLSTGFSISPEGIISGRLF
jgi:hypothetical protein